MEDFGSPNTTYSFTGIGGGTVTEVATTGTRAETVIYTAESSNAALYQLTSVSFGTHSQTVTPTSSSPTFAFQTNTATQTTTVSETVTHSGSTETLTYSSGANGNANSYWLSTDTVTITNPSTTLPNGATVSFSFGSSGSVTETETWGSHTFTHTDQAIPTATFTGLNTNTVTESTIAGNGVTTITYTGSASAGYAVQQVSTTFVPTNGATTVLSVNPCDRANFDFTTGTVTWIGPSGTAGTAKSLTANSHVTFTDLGAATGLSGDFVQETVTLGSHSSYEIFYSSTGTKGEYMEVAHGSATVDLTGLATQITALNQLHTLIT